MDKAPLDKENKNFKYIDYLFPFIKIRYIFTII